MVSNGLKIYWVLSHLLWIRSWIDSLSLVRLFPIPNSLVRQAFIFLVTVLSLRISLSSLEAVC